jgi:phosphotransferase system  glucose/maltose/N-acetylglucosamine-specific IIC component
MLKKIFFLFTLSLITSGQALACPMCMGTNPNDKYFLYVIGVFILLIYIPMYYLFRMFMKFKNVNQIEKGSDL